MTCPWIQQRHRAGYPARSAKPVALFLPFARMSLAGFAGALMFARRAFVEQQLCHFLPWPTSTIVDAQSRWPGLIQAALLPLSIAQLAASALILAHRPIARLLHCF